MTRSAAAHDTVDEFDNDQELRHELIAKLEAIGKSQAVIEFTMDGRILSANENFLLTLGYTMQEIQGQHHSMFVESAEKQSLDYRMFWEKLGRGEYDSGQYRRVGKGGREIYRSCSCDNPPLKGETDQN